MTPEKSRGEIADWDSDKMWGLKPETPTVSWLEQRGLWMSKESLPDWTDPEFYDLSCSKNVSPLVLKDELIKLMEPVSAGILSPVHHKASTETQTTIHTLMHNYGQFRINT